MLRRKAETFNNLRDHCVVALSQAPWFRAEEFHPWFRAEEFRAWGLGFRAWGFGFRGLGFRA